MAFDGIFLHQVVKQLQPLVNGRINKIHQVSDTEILFNIKGQLRYQLMISAHSSYNRIHITNRNYPSRETASNFIMVLRKYLEGGTIIEIKQHNYDRYLVIKVASRNEIGDRIYLDIYVELMGKYANIILVNNDKIIDALKRIPPFENNKRTIQPGALFKPTEAQSEKINPEDIKEIKNDENLFESIEGFSPILSNEFTYRLQLGQSYQTILNEILNSNKMYLYILNNDVYFHTIELTHLRKEPIILDICEGLDYLYFTKEEHERIRQLTGDLFKFTRKEIKKLETKLEKLEESYNEALDCDKWRIYGDLLMANQYLITKGVSSIEIIDFESNPIIVPVDARLDARKNGLKCYIKYRKATTSQKYIIQQKELTQNKLDYFLQIQDQLEIADFNSASEIRTELENNGYLKARKVNNRKKKQSEPHYKIIDFDDYYIMIGKNNIQNDFITFKKAHKENTWFHVKDSHGAHLIITKQNLNENDIRLCAMLTAYYSPLKESSSIPVNYTQVKYLKKIPGVIGKVIMNEYKTIYIDIDEKQIEQYIK